MNSRLLTLVAVLAVGVAGGLGIAQFGAGDGDDANDPSSGSGEKKILYWVAPMDPNYRRDKPGKSPMGMDLIPVYEGDEPGGEDAVRIDPAVVNNLGVVTATAETAMLGAPVHTVGRITVDEEKLAQVHLRSSGWIERLAVRAEGEPVARGDLLFEIYSPELVNAQAEFVQALKMGRASVVQASRERLGALGISGEQVAALEKTRTPAQYVKIFAPISGVVTKLSAADGMYVKPETQVMALADLSSVWLISDVFEADIDRVQKGAPVEAQSAHDPGTKLTGAVDYIYPDLDPVTRTSPVRTVLPNPQGDLKPGMFMTVRIDTASRGESLVIPREALIRTGRDERVILALGDGRFRPAQVVSGLEGDSKVEILSGLSAGEQVVVSGQFLIDSESSFAGATLRMVPDQGERGTSQPSARAMAPAMDATPTTGTSDDHMGHAMPVPVASSDAHAGHDMSGGMDMQGEHDMPMPAADTVSVTHMGAGTVNAVYADQRKLNLTHDPIASLGWPGMTMDFDVSSDIDLSTVNKGDQIRFDLQKRPDGGYAITRIEAAP